MKWHCTSTMPWWQLIIKCARMPTSETEKYESKKAKKRKKIQWNQQWSVPIHRGHIIPKFHSRLNFFALLFNFESRSTNLNIYTHSAHGFMYIITGVRLHSNLKQERNPFKEEWNEKKKKTQNNKTKHHDFFFPFVQRFSLPMLQLSTPYMQIIFQFA